MTNFHFWRASCISWRIPSTRSWISCGTGGMGGMVTKPYIPASASKRIEVILFLTPLIQLCDAVHARVMTQQDSTGMTSEMVKEAQTIENPDLE